ncbi:cytochrome P450 [Mycena maculata]|uniref:Cytochrome P450 n=1 Tax=Mycena maculata TaxID=230809 RepID=A0AAD7HFG3_9AGAR|nr:cytochrome P450 [Mycena maculata]
MRGLVRGDVGRDVRGARRLVRVPRDEARGDWLVFTGVALGGVALPFGMPVRIFEFGYAFNIAPHVVVLGTVGAVPVLAAVRIWATRLLQHMRARAAGARLASTASLRREWNVSYPLTVLREILATSTTNTLNLRTGWDDYIFTTKPEYIKLILATDLSNYVKGNAFHDYMGSVLGTGVFNSDGEMWKFHRGATRPFFNRDRISNFEIFAHHDNRAIERMKELMRAGYAGEPETLLDELLNSTSGEIYYTEDIRNEDEMLNILLAGRDTTMSVLTFVVYFLSVYPAVFTRLRAEILERVGGERRPTYEVIRDMKYLRAVVNAFQTLEIAHATTWPSPDPSLYIPAGAQISYSVFLMHRRTELWGPTSEVFDPDRFLDEPLRRHVLANPCCVLPFNAGPRVCLGQQFAYNEVSCPPHARVPPDGISELKREFTTLEMFGFGFSINAVVPSVAATLYYSIPYGGSSAMVWGWAVPSLFIMVIAMAIAGLGSAAQPQAAFITGPTNIPRQDTETYCAGWWPTLTPSLMAAATIGSNETFISTIYQTYGVYIGFLATYALIASFATRVLARLQNSLIAILALVILVGMPAATPAELKNTLRYAFWHFENLTLAPPWASGGFDAGVHLSEEAQNANVAVPWAIVYTIGAGTTLGLGVQIALAFCMGTDTVDILWSPVQQPLSTILLNSFGKRGFLVVWSFIFVALYINGVELVHTQLVAS